MHYRNGREAKNGDKVVSIGSNGEIIGLGVLPTCRQSHMHALMGPVCSGAMPLTTSRRSWPKKA